MTRRRGLSDQQIAKLLRKQKRYSLIDPVQPGLILRIPPQGPISFCAVARRVRGRQVWHTVGTTATYGIDEARILVREAIRRIRAGLPPAEPTPAPPQSVAAVAALWLEKKVEEQGYRTARERRRIVSYYIVDMARRNAMLC
jgi:hypothetical protein